MTEDLKTSRRHLVGHAKAKRAEGWSTDEWEERIRDTKHGRAVEPFELEHISALVWGWDKRRSA